MKKTAKANKKKHRRMMGGAGGRCWHCLIGKR